MILKKSLFHHKNRAVPVRLLPPWSSTSTWPLPSTPGAQTVLKGSLLHAEGRSEPSVPRKIAACLGNIKTRITFSQLQFAVPVISPKNFRVSRDRVKADKHRSATSHLCSRFIYFANTSRGRIFPSWSFFNVQFPDTQSTSSPLVRL